MIEDCARPGDEVRELMKIFTSFISDKISDFNTDLYYQIQIILNGRIEKEIVGLVKV